MDSNCTIIVVLIYLVFAGIIVYNWYQKKRPVEENLPAEIAIYADNREENPENPENPEKEKTEKEKTGNLNINFRISPTSIKMGDELNYYLAVTPKERVGINNIRISLRSVLVSEKSPEPLAYVYREERVVQEEEKFYEKDIEILFKGAFSIPIRTPTVVKSRFEWIEWGVFFEVEMSDGKRIDKALGIRVMPYIFPAE